MHYPSFSRIICQSLSNLTVPLGKEHLFEHYTAVVGKVQLPDDVGLQLSVFHHILCFGKCFGELCSNNIWDLLWSSLAYGKRDFLL